MKKIIKRLSKTIVSRLKSGIKILFGDISASGLSIREQTQLITDFSASVIDTQKPALKTASKKQYFLHKGRLASRQRLKTKRQALRDKALLASQKIRHRPGFLR
ncbi:hypothetical protein [Endozoicomonas numazuensis]|uniref:Uncharacterized protein n=1 Tax=Endozoicomonas numazuensis TaxID=1137799 RepID=A0A081NDQ8_9GAMM|nr:hypothetical protein [Endozoicomonas numazuensis]KEQ16581.1 hypothetical protein GZ78_22380 [Endozoicomonas numazuensis]